MGVGVGGREGRMCRLYVIASAVVLNDGGSISFSHGAIERKQVAENGGVRWGGFCN